MAMKLVKKTDEYSIYQRGDNRYAVRDANKQPVNGDDKARILVQEDLIKAALPPEQPAEEPEAEAGPAAETEATAEEAPADEEAPAGEAPAEEEASAEEAPAAEENDEEDK